MADNITSFGFPKLNLSGVPNVYEASSAPMHGYAEAIRKRKILQRIERMNRTRAILQASGLNVSDFTAGLRAQARSISPEQTRSQVEKENALRLLGDIVRQLKPRTKRQVENIVTAAGLGPDLMEDAMRMARVYDYGERAVGYGVDDQGQLTQTYGRKEDPRFIAAQQAGTAGSQFAATQQLSQHAENESTLALQRAEAAGITDKGSLQRFLATLGAEYKAEQEEGYQGKTLGFNPYDKDVRSALFSEYEKVFKEGERSPLYWLQKGPDGKYRKRFEMLPKGGKEYLDLIDKHGAVPRESDLGIGQAMQEQWEDASEASAKKAEGGDIMGAVADFKATTKNLWTPDRNKKVQDFIEYASKPMSAQFAYTKLKIETRNVVTQYLSEEQIAHASPEIDRGIKFIFDSYQNAPAGTRPDYRGDVSRLIDSLFPKDGSGEFGKITEPARKEIKERFEKELKFRQENVQFGLDVEGKIQSMDATDLSMQEARFRMQKLISENINIGQQGVVDRVVNQAYAMYKANDGRVGTGPVYEDTLGEYIRKQLTANGVIMMPELRDKIGAEVDRFEKAFIAAKRAPYELQKLQQDVIVEGNLWDIDGNTRSYKNAAEKSEILAEEGNRFIYGTNPALMNPIQRKQIDGLMPDATTKWDKYGAFKVARNEKELAEIMAEGFNLDGDLFQLDAATLAKVAGTYPEFGVLFSPDGNTASYTNTGELNSLLAQGTYVYKTNPMDDATIRKIGADIRTLPHLKEGVNEYSDVYFKYKLARDDMQSAWSSEVPGQYDLQVVDMWKKITDKSMITQEELRSYLVAQGYKLAFVTSIEKLKTGAQLSGPQRQAMMTAIHHALTIRGEMLNGYYSQIKDVYNAKYGQERGQAIFELAFLPEVKNIPRPDFNSPIYLVGAQGGRVHKGRKIKIKSQKVISR
jgi:hypothetical protein